MTDLPIGQGCLLLPGAADDVTDAHALRQRDAKNTRAHAAVKILRPHTSVGRRSRGNVWLPLRQPQERCQDLEAIP